MKMDDATQGHLNEEISMTDQPALPPDEFKLPLLNGDVKNIFMSFGLLSKLTTIIPDVDGIARVFLDPEIRESIFEVLLSERDDSGNVTVKRSHMNVPMTSQDGVALLNWAHDHIAHYFIDALSSMNKTASALQGKMNEMTSSLSTMEDSLSQTQPASPSQ